MSTHTVKFSEDGLVLITRGFMFDEIQQLSHQSYNRSRKEEPLPAYRDSTRAPDAESLQRTNPYGSLASTYEAVWRTLFWDRLDDSGSEKAPANYGQCFPNLYSESIGSFLAKLPGSYGRAVAFARDFTIHGRTLYQWAQFGHQQTNQNLKDTTHKVHEGEGQDINRFEEDEKSPEAFFKSLRLNRSRRLMTTEKG